MNIFSGGGQQTGDLKELALAIRQQVIAAPRITDLVSREIGHEGDEAIISLFCLHARRRSKRNCSAVSESGLSLE